MESKVNVEKVQLRNASQSSYPFLTVVQILEQTRAIPALHTDRSYWLIAKHKIEGSFPKTVFLTIFENSTSEGVGRKQRERQRILSKFFHFM